MLKAFLLSSLIYGYIPAETHHVQYQTRLDPIGIEQVKLLRPYFDTHFETFESNVILEGLIDLPRLRETGPIDGCQTVNKGLISGGGFMVFTCEKLLPSEPIAGHKKAFKRYSTSLVKQGWQSQAESTTNEKTFTKSDALGCEVNLVLRLWTDRSMNEPARPATQRNAHRQIVFMAKYLNDACETYYPIAEQLSLHSQK